MSEFPVPTVSLIDSRPATTSLAIAEHFDKNHQHVMRDIRALIADCPEDFNASNFGLVEYTDAKGEKRPMYHVFFDGFILLVMGYTGKKALQMKLAYIAAFNAMRQKLENDKAIPLDQLSITPDQQCTLRAIARVKVDSLGIKNNRGAYMQAFASIWSRFNNHFRIARYSQLAQSRMSEAVEYLTRLQPGSRLGAKVNVDMVEAVPDFDATRIYKDFLACLDKIDDLQARLAEVESSMGPSVHCVYKAGLSDEKMVCVRNAQDCIQIARANLKACEYALRSFARIRSKVSFLHDGPVPIVS